MNKKTNLIAIIAVVVVAVLGITAGYAWGNNESGSAHSSAGSTSSLSAVAARARATSHVAADAAFAMMMVEHHTQAIEMSELAASRAGSAQVKDLAARIEAAQGPEIDQMSGWLDDWGTSQDMNGMSHSMPGGMSGDDMSMLEKASGASFDTMFLQMMIKHHEGAIEMAGSELRSGENSDALALAASIMVSQQAQIAQMRGLLG